MSFERTLQKMVPVHPRLRGLPAPGREVTEVTSDPAEVRISGPKSRVQEVESAFTVSGMKRAMKASARIQIVP